MTITIQDLPVTDELDRQSMSAVRGGASLLVPPLFDLSKLSLSLDAQQLIGQTQNTLVNTGIGVAYASGISAQVAPKQNAQNLNVVNFSAL